MGTRFCPGKRQLISHSILQNSEQTWQQRSDSNSLSCKMGEHDGFSKAVKWKEMCEMTNVTCSYEVSNTFQFHIYSKFCFWFTFPHMWYNQTKGGKVIRYCCHERSRLSTNKNRTYDAPCGLQRMKEQTSKKKCLHLLSTSPPDI